MPTQQGLGQGDPRDCWGPPALSMVKAVGGDGSQGHNGQHGLEVGDVTSDSPVTPDTPPITPDPSFVPPSMTLA